MAIPVYDETQATDDADAFAVPKAFEICSEDSANWLVRKIIEVRQYRGKVKEWAERETKRSERDQQWLMARFAPQLEQWLEQWLLHSGSRRRSINLPAGMVGFRIEAPRLIVVDEGALLQWCRRHLLDALQIRAVAHGTAAVDLENSVKALGPRVKCETSISKSIINDYFSVCGELPEGMNITSRSQLLYIR